MFSGNLDRNIMDFMNDEEELLITFDKDSVKDTHIAASEDKTLVNISFTPNHSELEAFIDKEYDKYVVWRNNNRLLSKDTSSTNECITVSSTFSNTKVSTGCLKSPINTESSTNSNSDSNGAISNGTGKRYHDGENSFCSFFMKDIKFLRSEISFQMKLLKVYLYQNQCYITRIFFLVSQNKLKILIKTSIKKLLIQSKFYRDMYKMINEKDLSINQSNLDEDLPTGNMLSTLAPNQNDIKICRVINESVDNSSNRTKVNRADGILCTVNKNFANTATNEFFNTVNK